MRTSADLITFEFLTVILYYVTLKKYGFTKKSFMLIIARGMQQKQQPR